MWSVYAGTLPEHVDTVRSLIDDEIDRLVADGITDEELAVAVGYLVGRTRWGWRTPAPGCPGSAGCSSRGAR